MAAEASGDGVKKKIVDVNELLQKLQLSEAEKEGVFLAKEDKEGLPEIKWMAAARLLTTREFSDTSLISTMRSAWNLAQEVSFRPIGKNLYVVQAFCLGDWKRIMEDGPWIFRGCALMLEEFDGATNVPKTLPHKVLAWAQVHRLPHLYRTKAILEQVAGKVGETKEVDVKPYVAADGDFFRIRVLLEATKPLVRVVTLTPEGKDQVMLLIKYEKLPRFCSHCGIMGHTYLECGTGEFKEEELQFGAWMVAPEEYWKAGTPRFRNAQADRDWVRGRNFQGGSGRFGDRGRGRFYARGGGRSVPQWREKEHSGAGSVSRKRASGDADVGKEDDLDDTASSPQKPASGPATMEVEDSATRRELFPKDGEGDKAEPPMPPKYVSPREVKRAKKLQGKDGEGKGIHATEQAGSSGEARPAK